MLRSTRIAATRKMKCQFDTFSIPDRILIF
jgi:hypothetical protein